MSSEFLSNQPKAHHLAIPQWLVFSFLAILFFGIWGTISKLVSNDMSPSILKWQFSDNYLLMGCPEVTGIVQTALSRGTRRNVEDEFQGNTLMSLAEVGNQGRHLDSNRAVNQIPIPVLLQLDGTPSKVEFA